MSDKAITTNTTFEQRMFEQIRDKMGDLLTEDELKAILEKSIDKAFFTPRSEYNGYREVKLEPLFVEMLREELKPLIKAGAQQWLEDNQDKVAELLQKQLGDSAADMIRNAFSGVLSESFALFKYNLQSALGMQNI